MNKNHLLTLTKLVLMFACLSASATVFPTVQGALPGAPAQSGPDFEMTSTRTNLTLLQNAWAETFLSIKSLNGFGGSIQLWMSGWGPSGHSSPIGPFLSAGPVNLAPGGSENVTAKWISYDSHQRWADPGTYYSNVTGVSQGLSHSVLFKITVIIRPYFIVSVPVQSMTIQAGTSGSTIVTVTAKNGFSSKVAITGNGLGTPHGGIIGTADPQFVTGSGKTNLTISVDRSVPPGNYTLRVDGVPEYSPNSSTSTENGTWIMLHVLSPAPQASSFFGIPPNNLLVLTTALALGVAIVVFSFLFLKRRLRHSSALKNREEETSRL